MASILIVDDQLPNVQTLIVGLALEADYELSFATTGKDALAMIATHTPDLILLDVMMPGINGFDVCRQLKAQAATADIPVIFLTALDEIVNKMTGLEMGGVDYITKPFSIDEVKARIRVHLSLQEKQRQLKQLNEQDQHYFLQINTLRDELFSQFRHDVKTPLTSIRSSVYLLSRHCDNQNASVREYMNHVDRAVDEIVNMMDHILKIAELETGRSIQWSTVAIQPFIRTIISLFASLAETKHVTVTVNLENIDKDTKAMFDPEQMGSVLKNLLSNAIKYTLSGGTVRLTVTLYDQTLNFTVTDTGCGIPADDIQHIFKRFYRVKSQPAEIEGTGLGLYIVKSIVEQHGGNITAESQVNRGSTFTVTIPHYAPAGV